MEITDKNREELMRKAIEMLQFSYIPYSGYAVGAALLCKDGTVYTGCNIENAGYSATNCAERTAFFKAISEGHKDFAAIAVAGGHHRIAGDGCTPCGVCRQVMREFCDPKEFTVYLGSSPKRMQGYTLEELLPMSFGPDHLRKG